MKKVNLLWNGDMTFTGTADGQDTPFMINNKGNSPKNMLLYAVAGCSSLDVVYILEKMKAEKPEKFEVNVIGMLEEETPKRFTEISLEYVFEGKTDISKIKRAISMSLEKYCGVSLTLEKAVPINYTIKYNGMIIEKD